MSCKDGWIGRGRLIRIVHGLGMGMDFGGERERERRIGYMGWLGWNGEG